MIFNRLYIENFGCFHNFSLELDKGINRISEGNEFGKTTLLSFIQRIFWGFPDRRRKVNMYPPLAGSGRYGGIIELTLDNGETRRLERFGERGDLQIFYPDGKCETVASWLEQFGISENFYRNIYAFSIDELTRRETLDEAEIRQKLYGANLADEKISLIKLDDYFKKQSDIFFKQRGSAHKIAEISEEISELTTALAKAQAAYPAYIHAKKQWECQQKELETLNQEKIEITAQINRSELLLKAKDTEAELAADEKNLAALTASLHDLNEAEIKKLESELPGFRCAEEELIVINNDLTKTEDDFDKLKIELTAFLDYNSALAVEPDDYEKLEILNAAAVLARQQTLQKKLWIYRGILFSAVGLAFIALNWILGVLLVVSGLILTAVKYIFHPLKKTEKKLIKLHQYFTERFSFKVDISDIQLPNILKQLEKADNLQLHIKKLKERRDYVQEVIKRFDTELKKLNIESAELITELTRNCDSKKILIARINSRHSALERYFPDFTNFRQEIVDASPEKLGELKQQMEDIDNHITTLKMSADNTKFSVRQFLENSDTAIIDTKLAAARKRLHDAISGYLRWSAARKLLALAISRFEREHQPELLLRAGNFFSDFTSGRYTKIRKPLTSEILRFTDSISNMDKDFDTLSRGSREAALLAFRLALIAERETLNEKIPLIMDDIAVNFDTERAAAIDTVLQKFADERQIIMFCHTRPFQN